MKLYLIRHAHAVDAAENARRPLSARGRAQVAQLVAYFRTAGQMNPAEIWHSPLARSQETASRLAAGVPLDAPLAEIPGLEPEDNPSAIARELRGRRADVAIVGHEPHLSLLATLLVHGAGSAPSFAFEKGGVLALERVNSQWAVKWETAPGKIDARKPAK